MYTIYTYTHRQIIAAIREAPPVVVGAVELPRLVADNVQPALYNNI